MFFVHSFFQWTHRLYSNKEFQKNNHFFWKLIAFITKTGYHRYRATFNTVEMYNI